MRNLYADSLEPLTGMTLPFFGTSIGWQEPKTETEGGEIMFVAMIMIVLPIISKAMMIIMIITIKGWPVQTGRAPDQTPFRHLVSFFHMIVRWKYVDNFSRSKYKNCVTKKKLKPYPWVADAFIASVADHLRVKTLRRSWKEGWQRTCEHVQCTTGGYSYPFWSISTLGTSDM